MDVKEPTLRVYDEEGNVVGEQDENGNVIPVEEVENTKEGAKTP